MTLQLYCVDDGFDLSDNRSHEVGLASGKWCALHAMPTCLRFSYSEHCRVFPRRQAFKLPASVRYSSFESQAVEQAISNSGLSLQYCLCRRRNVREKKLSNSYVVEFARTARVFPFEIPVIVTFECLCSMARQSRLGHGIHPLRRIRWISRKCNLGDSNR